MTSDVVVAAATYVSLVSRAASPLHGAVLSRHREPLRNLCANLYPADLLNLGGDGILFEAKIVTTLLDIHSYPLLHFSHGNMNIASTSAGFLCTAISVADTFRDASAVFPTCVELAE
ncbi:hypothetical protein D9619_011270 [Psilocybe cf. subviscida]|uniref:Uncharacterized protein n=1 Tax=Psilocybe cf. subviscida TaxID=2480587 RepID=A0A8H5BIX2_9AGAR|nr:hypothetical protein D9619_011270 [Psilocybe cf. subviscida]